MLSPNQEELNLFHDLSVELTGHNLITLYGTGNGADFLKVLEDYLGYDLVFELLSEFERLKTHFKPEEGDFATHVEYRLASQEKWAPICQNIVKLWYMGNWYQLPKDWYAKYVPKDVEKDNPGDFPFMSPVISSQAYIEGLVWKTMNRHPKSAKQPGYGTWAFAPE